MAYNFKVMISWLLVAFSITFINAIMLENKSTVLVVLGSARKDSVSRKIAHIIQKMGDKSIIYEIIDLQDYNLPLVNPDKENSDPGINAWRNKFEQALAVVFLVPNYNAGYSGILKNGIDALGSSAKNKPVALIAYSGRDAAFAWEAVDALKPVLKTLQMKIVDNPILIGIADSAFTESGDFKKPEAKEDITNLLDRVCKAIKN